MAVPAPLPRLFDYLPPANGNWPLPGMRVEVEFGRRTLVGVVWAHAAADPSSPRLKQVRACLDDTPVLDADLMALCQHAADYYHHPIGEVVATCLPNLLRQGDSARIKGELFWQLTDRGQFAEPEALSRAPRQRQALEIIREHSRGAPAALLTALDVPRSALTALEKKGWISLREQQPAQKPHTSLLAQVPLTASAEQEAAIRALQKAEGFTPYLLDGVTGSGKTEVYLQAMTPLLEQGRQILVLVPEIGLTPQTVRRFERRFNVPVVALHSGLTDRERLHGWVRARDGEARIILGTRSAVFTPLPDAGLIIVDEAHDGSFKQQDGFRYSARDLAVWRARLLDIPVLLGSATPALETLQLALDGRYRHLQLNERAGGARKPQIKLEDCRQLPGHTPVSPRSLAAIRDTLARGEQVLVFLNRRGFAPVIRCQDCGWEATCDRCSTLMTWHRAAGRLICHHCDSQRRVPPTCPDCGSQALQDAGSGTEKLEAVLSESFPDDTVVRIDRDTTRRKGSLQKALERIQAGQPAILVGTQMLAKGHHFSNLTLAVILDADAGFLSADFRGPEHAGQLILQVAGRTGRGERPGTVLIQTRHPDLPLLHTLLKGDYRPLANALLADRRAIGLPPFGYLAMFRAESPRREDAESLLETLADLLADCPVQTMGPIPAPLERRQGRYRFQLLVLSSHRPTLHQTLEQALASLRDMPEARRCRWQLDVDPLDML